MQGTSSAGLPAAPVLSARDEIGILAATVIRETLVRRTQGAQVEKGGNGRAGPLAHRCLRLGFSQEGGDGRDGVDNDSIYACAGADAAAVPGSARPTRVPRPHTRGDMLHDGDRVTRILWACRASPGLGRRVGDRARSGGPGDAGRLGCPEGLGCVAALLIPNARSRRTAFAGRSAVF